MVAEIRPVDRRWEVLPGGRADADDDPLVPLYSAVAWLRAERPWLFAALDGYQAGQLSRALALAEREVTGR